MAKKSLNKIWLNKYQNGGEDDFASLLNSTLDAKYGKQKPVESTPAPKQQVVSKPAPVTPKPVVVAAPPKPRPIVAIQKPAVQPVAPQPVVEEQVETLPPGEMLPEVKVYRTKSGFPFFETENSFKAPYYSVGNPNYKKPEVIAKPTETKHDDFNLADLASAAYNSIEHAYDATANFFDKTGNFIAYSPTYAKRYLQKKGLMDLDQEEVIKAKPVQVTVKKDETDNYIVPEEYKELKRTANNYLSYYNIFDNRKGFNYIPTARLGDSKKVYKGVQGMAHFVYDYDFTSEQPADNSNAKKFHENIQYVSGLPTIIDPTKNNHESPGSTVKDYYYTVYHKNPDGTVNIKYKKENEFEKGDKLGDPLRQYRFTDIDWNGPGMQPAGFNSTISALRSKSGDQTYLIYPKSTGKGTYGKFGGGSVVFIVQGTPVAMDFSGSLDQIKEQGEQLVKQFNIKPEDLIIAYHDLGSYSAKPDDINGEISLDRYYGYNTNTQTGAGLAIPVKKKDGGWINKYQDGTSNVQVNKYDPVVKAYLEQSLGNNDKVLITDRGTNTTYYGSMDPNGKWNINQFEVLTGAGGVDPYNNVQPWKFPLSDREQNKDLKVTAVGSYPLQYMDDMYGMPGYAIIDPYEGVNGFNAYHTTYVGEDDPNRAALYANNNNEDNYRSYGCINCQKPSMQNLIDFVGKDPKGMQSLIIDSRLSPKENDELIKMNTPWSKTTAYMEQVPVKVRTSKKYGGWLNKYK